MIYQKLVLVGVQVCLFVCLFVCFCFLDLPPCSIERLRHTSCHCPCTNHQRLHGWVQDLHIRVLSRKFLFFGGGGGGGSFKYVWEGPTQSGKILLRVHGDK